MMIQEVATSELKWRDVCRLMGQLYRYEFDNILMIYAQRPHATLVADFDTWKKVNRYVMRGSKGIAIFPSRALHPRMRYVFDICDTGGKKQDLTWDLNGEKLTDFVAFMKTSGLFKEESNQVDSDDLDAQDIFQKILKTQLKNFTRTYVRAIIKEEYSDRINELTRLVGEYGLEKDDIMNEADNSPNSPVAQFIYQSAFYAIGTRCGFDLDIQEQDFGSVLRYQSEDEIYLIGTLVSDISCNVLREFARNLKQMEKQRMLLEERGITHGRDRIDLYGEGGNPISESGVTEGGRAESPQPWEIRNDGIELSDGERTGTAQDINEIRIVDTENVRSGRRGKSASGYPHDGLSGEEQAERSKFHDRDVADQRAGEDAGRGNRIESDRIEISLEHDQIESEIKQELDEINSFGKQGEANYQQASFSFDNAVGQTKYTYLEAKKELIVPHEYVVEVILRGSGFANGKGRIAIIYQNESVPSERAKLIKKEYGLGGAGWPIDGYGLHGYNTFKNQGIGIKWRDEEGEKEGYVSWAVVEQEIGALILTGVYDKDQLQNNTKSIDGDSVGYDEIELVDENDTDHEDRESLQREQQWIDDEILDDFAIPDELDEMYGVVDEVVTIEGLSEDRLPNDLEYMSDITTRSVEVGSLPRSLIITEKRNFHYTQLDVDAAGAKTRYNWNVEAIRTLFQIEGDGRFATTEEQKVLAKYVGWGGLSQVFNDADNSWRHEYVELKNLLLEDDYVAARASVNNAFYTSPEIASCKNQALVRFGFQNGNILEPSMGIGNFFGSLPTAMQNYNLFGVEIDSISGRIAKQLYQNADIRITGFEKTSFPDNFFDVAIGNVPFGDYKLFDPKYNKLNFRIHDYFLAKSIDQVRPGGIIAFITTKGTLDKSNPSVRKYLAERAELIGAIRLPNTAFRDNAGTDVATDILFLQKRERAIVVEPDWVHLGYTENGIAVNSYFVEHPEMMLGTMEYDTRMFGDGSKYTTCVNRDPDFNLYDSIQKAIWSLSATITDYERFEDIAEEPSDHIPASPDVRNYTYTFMDGKLYYRENSRMYQKELSLNMEERIKAMDKIRIITRELITLQTEGCSEEVLINNQKSLNETYDAFTMKYGYLTSRENDRAFRNDSDYPLLCSLEVVDEDGKVKKADMFYKQTIKPKLIIERVETAVEALNISMNEYGTVNLPFMLSIYHPCITNIFEDSHQVSIISEQEKAELERKMIIDELSGLIFLNPMSYNENNLNAGWESADEYLSGNVRDKFRIAKAFAETNPELF